MKRLQFITAILFIGIICVAVFGCSKSDTYNNSTDPGTLYKVSILSTQFDPASITMLVNYKLTWTNMDTDAHSIVSDDGLSFNSGPIPAGAAFSFTPSVTGTFAYHCGIHPAVQGTVNVVNK